MYPWIEECRYLLILVIINANFLFVIPTKYPLYYPGFSRVGTPSLFSFNSISICQNMLNNFTIPINAKLNEKTQIMYYCNL